jgi:hypothetical protein
MNLLLKFPDASQSFCNGVEFGRLLEKMQRGDEYAMNAGFPVRIENRTLIENACKEYGYIASFGPEYFNEWIDFIGIKKTYNEN